MYSSQKDTQYGSYRNKKITHLKPLFAWRRRVEFTDFTQYINGSTPCEDLQE